MDCCLANLRQGSYCGNLIDFNQWETFVVVVLHIQYKIVFTIKCFAVHSVLKEDELGN